MTSRQRIGLTGVGGGGGGGGPAPTGNVQWGPDFGNPPETDLGVSVSMPAVAIVNNKVIGVSVNMNALAIANDKQVGVALDLDSVAIANSKQIGASVTMPALLIANEKSIGATITLPAVALANDESIGVHLSGSVQGAPFVRSVSSYGSSTAAASHDVTAPSGIQEGDFLIAFCGVGGGQNIDVPSGWTEVRTQLNTVRLTVFRKFAGASEPGTYTFDIAGSASSSFIATIIRMDGVDPTTPINVQGGQTGSATDPVAPSITTTVANCLKICACAQNNTLNADYTPPASYTERSDLNGNGLLGALNMTGTVATRPQASAAASGTVTMDSTQILSTAYVSAHVAIAPGPLEIAA